MQTFQKECLCFACQGASIRLKKQKICQDWYVQDNSFLGCAEGK